MAKKKELREEAREAGARNVVPGQAYLAALLRGLQREMRENSQGGAPFGQALQEELGSVGFDDALREMYPGEFSSGKLEGSEYFPTDVAALGVRPFGRASSSGFNPGQPLLSGPPSRPMLSGPQERLALPAPPRQLPAPRSYWEEGAAGREPPLEDIPSLVVRRNPQEFYSQRQMDEMSARMRAGDRGAFRDPLYSGVADRPNYGEAPAGPSPFERMPRPGISNRRGIPDRPNYGEGGGVNPFLQMPSPGVRPRQAGTALVPYEGAGLPMGGGGRGMVPMGSREMVPYVGREMVPIGERGMVPVAGGGTGEVEFDFGFTPEQFHRGAPAAGNSLIPALAAMGIAGGMPAALDYGQMSVAPSGGRGQYQLPQIEVAGARQAGQRTPAPQARLAAAPSPAQPRQRVVAPAQRAAALKGQKRAVASRGKPVPPRRPAGVGGEEGFEPNFNYHVTKALDNLFGTNEAEKGRQTQQYYSKHPQDMTLGELGRVLQSMGVSL